MEISDLVYIDATGYHFADYPTFLEFFTQAYKDIYGADSYLEPDSQDGQNIAIKAKAAYDSAALGSAIYNSFRPTDAQGTGLSRLVKINGLDRIDPTHSTVDVTIVGVAGTIITNGVAQDTLGQKWDLPSPTTIPGGGTVTVTATAQEVGAIRAESDTVNSIFTPTRGWQSVNNDDPATVGQAVESDAELRVRQTISTANPSNTVFVGTEGAVANVEGVTSIRGYENDTGSTDGDGIPAHSICIVVEGGDTEEICQVIALHKTPGTQTFGTTSELVYDSRGMPLTIYIIRPTLVTISAGITIAADAGWSDDYEAQIQQAVADMVNAIGIGNTVLYSRFFQAAYLPGVPGTTYDIVDVEIAKNLDPPGTTNIPIDFDELPFTDVDVDITVIVT